MKIKFGWIPDTPDHRDYYLSVPKKLPKLPPVVDMRSNCPPVYNQGSLGSCTAQSIAGALHFTMLEGEKTPFVPSRLFIYYNTRVLHGTVGQDSGASLRNTIKAVVKNGYCQEVLWPYRVKDFKVKPASKAYQDSVKIDSLDYARVYQDLDQLKLALYENNPIIFGFSVYESFQSQTVAKTGFVPMPKRNERMLGGHAVILVGYDDRTKMFICRNSWGQGWGISGYFFMPYAFVLNEDLAADFWIIKGV
jgi:C1A family cysteine protease